MEGLQVFHQPKATSRGESSGVYPGFYMDTCQRRVWVNPCFKMDAKNETSPVEVFRGYEAYLFLLRFAAGLESEVQGETDIFGQIKEAWRNEKNLNSSVSQDLDPWMQRLFEDTKDIRSRFLQNLGGSSYGSLVRKLIHHCSKKEAEGPILIVGAGKIAHSVTPLLLDHDLWLLNRNSENQALLYQSLAPRAKAQLRQLTKEDEAQAWRDARHVVVCIPFDEILDEKRVSWFQQGGHLESRSIVHLGGRRADCGIWDSLPLFHCLDELFELEKTAGKLRSIQISRAIKACEERAKLRALGLSLSISHGWEDLAAFV